MADTIFRNIEQLSATDKLRQELIANVSHDLRTPLAIMHGYIETLQIRHDRLSPEEQQKFLGIAHDSSQNLSRLVSQLFEYSKLEAGQAGPVLEPVFVSELVNDILTKYQLIARNKNVLLRMEAPSGLPHILADIAQMERVIQNLMDNALKFTHPGGSIRILLSQRSATQIEIAVWDDGDGIPHEQQSLIFERYKQLQQDGESKGMGLRL
ncbi:sensor histidine kinase [Chitinophaga sp. NPDC101104]|uniref:sensor histidine kinase n=1 Tax=Chitinophaga sp. NPDC101104 TaxID=3390561 RepID=UPI003CFD4410